MCAAPTVVMRTFPRTLATTALDTAGERLAALSGQATISTGVGNELDFGTIDISGGAANSLVFYWIWHISADGGNTLAQDFRLWLSSSGFDQAGTKIKYQPISGADQGSASSTENYIQNAVTGSYTWADMATSLPGAQNVFPSDEGSSMALSTTSDDAIMVAMYAAIASGETTGTYRGTTSNYQLQFSHRYTYS